MEGGWLYFADVEAIGFVGATTMYLLKNVGFREARLNKLTSELLEDAQKASVWLWLRRTGIRPEQQANGKATRSDKIMGTGVLNIIRFIQSLQVLNSIVSAVTCF